MIAEKSYLDWEKSKRIELILNQVKFKDILVGEMLSHYLSILSDQGYNKQSIGDKLKQLLIKLRYSINLKNSFETNITGEEETGKILFGLTDNSKRLTDFIEPLANVFNLNNILIFSSKESEFLPNEKQVFRYVKGLSKQQYRIWRFHYNASKKIFYDALHKLQSEFEISNSITNQLKLLFLVQSQRAIVIEAAIEKLKPCCLIVDHDRQYDNSLLVSICNANNIPTFTLIHGLTIPPYSSYPVIANYLLAWGDFHKEQFSGLGLSGERIIVCGNYKVDRTLSISRDSYHGTLFKDRAKKIVLFASTNFNYAQKIKITREYCQASLGLKDQAYFAVRLHPSEKMEDFAELKVEFQHVIFLTHNDLSYEESLGLSDLIIGHNTAFIVDAYLKLKPILVFDSNSITYPIGLGGIINENDKVLYARNTEELASELNVFIASESSISINNPDWFCKFLGKEALDKYKDEISTRLR